MKRLRKGPGWAEVRGRSHTVLGTCHSETSFQLVTTKDALWPWRTPAHLYVLPHQLKRKGNSCFKKLKFLHSEMHTFWLYSSMASKKWTYPGNSQGEFVFNIIWLYSDVRICRGQAHLATIKGRCGSVVLTPRSCHRSRVVVVWDSYLIHLINPQPAPAWWHYLVFSLRFPETFCFSVLLIWVSPGLETHVS